MIKMAFFSKAYLLSMLLKNTTKASDMKRSSLLGLKNWFSKKNKKPLILRGARQVGKSTLVRMFCKEQGLDLLEINFEKTKLTSVQKNQKKMEEILDEIQLLLSKKITSNSLIFLDEIQEQPEMLKFLRFFYEERPELNVIAAGSLLELALKSEDFSFPVGRVEFYYLSPFYFSEFLLATGQDLLYENLEKGHFSSAVHLQATEQLKKYFYIGGMPQVIQTYIDEKSIVSAQEIHHQIIQSYYSDFPKYNNKIKHERLEKVFLSMIHLLGKKVIYSKVDAQAQARDTRKVIELLIDAKILLPCYHTDATNSPLLGQQDLSISKMYFLDIGLLNSLLRLDPLSIDNEFRQQFNTKGFLAEQFIAQHINYWDGPTRMSSLNFWLRDKGIQKGEIDFLIEKNNQIIPIEIKSSASGHLKSLFYFSKEHKINFAIKLSLAPFSREKVSHIINEEKQELEILSLPLYAVEFLKNHL